MVAAVIGRRPLTAYDAEYHIGLQANDSSVSVATDNAAKLNEALAAMHATGYFVFSHGTPGPVTKPIMFAAKEFYFKGPLITSARTGGSLCGVGSRPLGLPADDYTPEDGSGGNVSRLTRIDGTTNSPVIRLRGSGFVLDGLDIQGRPRGGAGVLSDSCVEVEGRADQLSGRHVIRNCELSGSTYGIKVLAGYYNDDNGFVAEEAGADSCEVSNVDFTDVSSCFRSQNNQALGWRFEGINLRQSTGDVVVFDLVRGGRLLINGLQLDHNKVTLFKVTDYFRQSQRLDCSGMYWGEYNAGADYLTLFQYAGSSVDAGELRWAVRVMGGIDNTLSSPTYDVSKLIQIDESAVGFPLNNLLFDICQMPTNGFQRISEWFYPSSFLLS